MQGSPTYLGGLVNLVFVFSLVHKHRRDSAILQLSGEHGESRGQGDRGPLQCTALQSTALCSHPWGGGPKAAPPQSHGPERKQRTRSNVKSAQHEPGSRCDQANLPVSTMTRLCLARSQQRCRCPRHAHLTFRVGDGQSHKTRVTHVPDPLTYPSREGCMPGWALNCI